MSIKNFDDELKEVQSYVRYYFYSRIAKDNRSSSFKLEKDYQILVNLKNDYEEKYSKESELIKSSFIYSCVILIAFFTKNISIEYMKKCDKEEIENVIDSSLMLVFLGNDCSDSCKTFLESRFPYTSLKPNEISEILSLSDKWKPELFKEYKDFTSLNPKKNNLNNFNFSKSKNDLYIQDCKRIRFLWNKVIDEIYDEI